jgi:hypothetical protein
MIIVPIGIDCGIATFLRDNNLRNFSLPFDWCVTYNGVADIIKHNFSTFLPKDNSIFCDSSCTSFIHCKFPDDIPKMERRIERFNNLLNNTTDYIVFYRKGHAYHNHQESINHKCLIKNDIIDSEELALFLKIKYPNLKFKIITVLFCSKCFNYDKVYDSNSDSIIIYNKAYPNMDNDTLNSILNDTIQSINK